jgi:hypothetical protein
MPRCPSFAAALVLCAAVAAPAQAASLSVTTGWVDSSESGYDPATIASLRLGTRILDLGVADFDLGVEAAKDIEKGTTASDEDWGFQSLGAYLSGRTAGPVYLIGRLGVAHQEIDVGGRTDDGTQTSVGIGAGTSIGILRLEVTANRYGSAGDLDDITWVSAGISF